MVTEKKCRDAMNSELQALEDNATWELTALPKGRKDIGCEWLQQDKAQLLWFCK